MSLILYPIGCHTLEVSLVKMQHGRQGEQKMRQTRKNNPFTTTKTVQQLPYVTMFAVVFALYLCIFSTYCSTEWVLNVSHAYAKDS